MLAYVFSHQPSAEADLPAYENLLRQFHDALAAAPPAGFVRSLTFRVSGGDYSDWYLVDSSAALDPLNLAAVTGARVTPHDSAARLAAKGSGKLMTLVSGTLDPRSVCEIRFSKPAGMTYAELERVLSAWSSKPGVSLWRRMMVLGPPPEFAILAPSNLDLPAATNPEALRIESI